MRFVITSGLLKISKTVFNSMFHTIVAEILLETGPVYQVRLLVSGVLFVAVSPTDE